MKQTRSRSTGQELLCTILFTSYSDTENPKRGHGPPIDPLSVLAFLGHSKAYKLLCTEREQDPIHTTAHLPHTDSFYLYFPFIFLFYFSSPCFICQQIESGPRTVTTFVPRATEPFFFRLSSRLVLWFSYCLLQQQHRVLFASCSLLFFLAYLFSIPLL